jgi:uncharacterized protein YeaO (DUF488 family)
MKDIAPSPELRRLVAEGAVALIFDARDRAHNDAALAAEFLKRGG